MTGLAWKPEQQRPPGRDQFIGRVHSALQAEHEGSCINSWRFAPLWNLGHALGRPSAEPMKTISITGGCYCGQVRYQATEKPIYQANCHCANCRRAAGAQAVAWITVHLEHFRFVSGAPKRFRTDTAAWRTFCDRCGTSLTYENDRRPGEIDITTGSLDHPEDFAPNKDVFPEERLAWVPLVPRSAECA